MNLLKIFPILVAAIEGSLFTQFLDPIIGSQITYFFWVKTLWAANIAAVAIFCYYFFLKVRSLPLFILKALIILTPTLLFIMTGIVRPAALQYYYPTFDRWILNMRYSYFASAIGWLMYSVILEKYFFSKRGLHIRLGALLFLTHVFFGIHKNLWFEPYQNLFSISPLSHWRDHLPQMEARRTGRSHDPVYVPVMPSGFFLYDPAD